MDELNMEGLELPDTGEDYEGGDVIDVNANKSENRRNMPVPSDDELIKSGMEMPVLSDMDDSSAHFSYGRSDSGSLKEPGVNDVIDASALLSEMDGGAVSTAKIRDEDKRDPASFNKAVGGSRSGSGMSDPSSLLSEMDGGAVSAAKIRDEDKSDPASFSKAVGGSRSGAPVFEEMGGVSAEAKPVALNKPRDGGEQRGSRSAADTGSRGSSYDDMYGSSYRNNYSSAQNAQRENALDMAMRMKQENYENGKGKAKILGGIVIGAAALRLVSSLASGWSITTFLNIALAGVIGYCAYKFMQGSDKARRTLGWVTLFDAGDCIYGIISYFTLKAQLEKIAQFSIKVSEAFGGGGADSEEAAAALVDVITPAMKFALFTSVVGLIVFAVMTYFFLLDSSVSDFTIDD